MDANYIHKECHSAMCQCPQFRGWDDDCQFDGYGAFGNIPKKGIYKTVQFWREYGDLLWNKGYEEELPQDVRDLFDNVDRVIAKAIKDYCQSL